MIKHEIKKQHGFDEFFCDYNGNLSYVPFFGDCFCFGNGDGTGPGYGLGYGLYGGYGHGAGAGDSDGDGHKKWY